MEVGVSELRANLSHWLDVVREGAEVVVTERGEPVARLLGVETTAALQRLADAGAIGGPPRAARPVAGSRSRPRPRRPVADRVAEQRD